MDALSCRNTTIYMDHDPTHENDLIRMKILESEQPVSPSPLAECRSHAHGPSATRESAVAGATSVCASAQTGRAMDAHPNTSVVARDVSPHQPLPRRGSPRRRRRVSTLRAALVAEVETG